MPRHPAARGQPPEPGVLILASLAGGPKHGHAMIADIERLAGVHLGPGTLYGALHRLEERGLIEPLPVDELRRPYRLTDLGRTVLAEQLATFRQFAEAGLARLATS
ncbi:MAG TPA: helix-turn-helix transcriptional regulator [Candidatus Limnocylindrales bacterium]|nr:helix-turn-helix transcriptional regulator [Candidatus Limnocylindrales bacterium]